MCVLCRSKDNERGSAMVEYALMIAMIGIGLIGAVTKVREDAEKALADAGKAIATAGIGIDPSPEPPPPM